MNKISTLTSLPGRKLVHETFHELRYSRNRSSIATLLTLWRICTFEKRLNKYVSKDVEISMPLGFFRGTALWMEEVVNRFYFTSINSFVYLGAAILLVIIGLRRFDENISIELVFGGIIFESLMLLFMFIVMLFTPSEEDLDDNDTSDDLLVEIGEIGRDFAAAVVQLEQITNKFSHIADNQIKLFEKLDEIATTNKDAIAPNPEMIREMKETNISLSDFRNTIEMLNNSVSQLKKEEIDYSVKKHIEKFLSDKINSNDKGE